MNRDLKNEIYYVGYEDAVKDLVDYFDKQANMFEKLDTPSMMCDVMVTLMREIRDVVDTFEAQLSNDAYDRALRRMG